MFTSCSSTDDSGEGGTMNYMPLEIGNYWKYNVSNDGTATGQDSLYVANDTLVGTITYKKMKTLNQPIGFFSNSLNNNGLRKDGSMLKVNGNASIAGIPIPIEIPLNDFVIFKETASNNQELSSTSGTLEQTVSTYPLKIDYTMKSISVETLASFTTPAPDNKTYTDVKKVKTIMNIKVTTVLSGIFTVTLIAPQDVVISEQYYSKNLGMVYANTVTSYHFEDLSALPVPVTLPFPESGTQTQEEFLDTYQVD